MTILPTTETAELYEFKQHADLRRTARRCQGRFKTRPQTPLIRTRRASDIQRLGRRCQQEDPRLLLGLSRQARVPQLELLALENQSISIETTTRRVYRYIQVVATTTRSTLRIPRHSGIPAKPHGTTRDRSSRLHRPGLDAIPGQIDVPGICHTSC